MTGLVRKATLFGACGLLAASTALANQPDCNTSAPFPNWVKVVGLTAAGLQDPAGQFCLTVRDFANNPISGARVELDFSECCDINICGVDFPNPYEFKSCVPPVVSGRTDPGGQLCLTVIGAAKDPGSAIPPAILPGAGLNCIKIRLVGATTDPCARATAVAHDQDAATNTAGTAGLTAGDQSKLATRVGAAALGAPYTGRADYNCDGTISAGDQSVQATEVGRAALGTGSSIGCPGNAYCKIKTPPCP